LRTGDVQLSPPAADNIGHWLDIAKALGIVLAGVAAFVRWVVVPAIITQVRESLSQELASVERHERQFAQFGPLLVELAKMPERLARIEAKLEERAA
jgi:hypothetical protein